MGNAKKKPRHHKKGKPLPVPFPPPRDEMAKWEKVAARINGEGG